MYQGVVLADGSLRTDYLPAAATANGMLPAVACYVSSSANGPYLLLATEYTYGSTCGIVRDGIGSFVAMANQSPGMFGWFVIVY